MILIRSGKGRYFVLFLILSRIVNGLKKPGFSGLSVLALDLIPRTTRAQSMDILSSMATVSGYKAVLEAASLLPRFSLCSCRQQEQSNLLRYLF